MFPRRWVVVYRRPGRSGLGETRSRRVWAYTELGAIARAQRALDRELPDFYIAMYATRVRR